MDSWNKIVCSDVLELGAVYYMILYDTHGTEQFLIGLPRDS